MLQSTTNSAVNCRSNH